MTQEGLPIGMVEVTCDGLDSTFTVMSDTATGQFRIVVPRGRCVLNSLYNEEIILDLQTDTVLELEATTQLFYYDNSHYFHSRQQKDSLFHAQEAALRADLDGMDTTYWPACPKYVSLVVLYQRDLYYILPRWRTFSLDTILNHIKYCYFKDPEKYNYLYYDICQLERRMGLKHDPRVREPKGPDGSWYVPMPEMPKNWIDDTLTCYSGRFESVRRNSDYLKMDFASQGEKSLVYPRRKKPVVRMLVYGGLSDYTALRVEDGRFYYCTADSPWEIDEARHRERWDVKLTRGELDSLARCLDTLLMAGDERVLDDGYAIDAPNIEFEYSDRDGYRNYVCANPEKHPLTAPLSKYLDTLWRRNVCCLSVPIHDAVGGEQISFANIALDGRNYHHLGGSGYFRGPRFYVPKGKYTLRIECPGYESYERKLNIQGDLALDTIRLEHKRISFRTRLCADNGIHLTDTVALYVDGVDTAMLAPIDWLDQTVEYHNVPAASRCYFVETNERVGGWYHSQVCNIRDSMDYDSIPMHLDRSRQPFRSRAEKDSTLKADVFHWEIGGLYPFAELGSLYYYDALLKYMPTWRTFLDADSLAYEALCTAYHHDPQEYGYLYYPITHLADRSWHLKKDNSIQKPTLDSNCYVPIPEELWEENHYGCVDLLTPFLEAKQENDRFRRLLGSLKESSLLVSHPQGPVLRWHCVSHHGGTLYCQRIQDDTLYDKEFFNTFGLTDPFDTTIDQDPDHYPDTLIVRKHPLTAAEKETLTALLRAIHNENHHGTVGQRLGISPILYHFEYILDGHYHHFSAIHNFDDSTDQPTPSVNALMKWVSTLLE